MEQPEASTGILLRVVKTFLDLRLSAMLICIALCLGAAALLVTPKEEEPQIVVPMADIYVSAPGASAREVEQLVATPLEQLLWQIDGVEYVYSMARKDSALVTVRFFVGEDREDSLVKLHNRISMNIDRVSSIIKGWVIKPVEIDDVPIVNITLYSQKQDDYVLRRIGEEVLARIGRVKNISRTTIHGGREREIRVELVPEKMQAMGVDVTDVAHALKGADVSVTAGSFSRANGQFPVRVRSFLMGTDEINSLVVGIHHGRPVYVRDVAHVADVPCKADTYSRITFSEKFSQGIKGINNPGRTPKNLSSDISYHAVTLAISKKRGTNAVTMAEEVIEAFEKVQAKVVPEDVYFQVTRNYGQTAKKKVGGLVQSLGFAIVSVVVLLIFTLGWKEALVVAVAVPVSFSLALFVNYLFGYTMNRVTLFALILSLGLVVDDPITNVENIQRHIRQGIGTPVTATIMAVGEVLLPVIISTLAIIACFVPLFFITGMMGPYMGPMAINVPLTVVFSTLCALTVVPCLSHLLLRSSWGKDEAQDAVASTRKKGAFLAKFYENAVSAFLDSASKRRFLFIFVVVLLLASACLVVFRAVPLKLLPFDNKNEFQIVLDMGEGTPPEATDAAVRDFEAYLKTVPDVTFVVSFTGEPSPMDFNGMVRHYYLRKAGNYADIRVNLLPRKDRKQQSHAIVLRLRKDLEAIAAQHGAKMKLVEVPPGPPVLSTIVAEVYAPVYISHGQLLKGADHVKFLMAGEPFVVDVETMTETPHREVDIVIDREKAAFHGIDTRTISRTLATAMEGIVPAHMHLPRERQPLNVRLTLPRDLKSGIDRIKAIPLKTASGKMVSLAELANIQFVDSEPGIFHKNLERVVYVLADTAGRAPAEAVLDLQKRLKKHPLPHGIKVKWNGEGEWKITLRVFRDMGIAFAAALLGIYLLLVIQSGSFFMPVLIMMAIPLTLLGILPGFWLLNLVGTSAVGGFHNPIFLTATSMIGMIALGGIVIRNSLVLIEFIQEATQQGMPLRQAILQSGIIRMRPILLTALTTAIGAFPITFDPVFSGLAWALIFGLVASTLFTLVVIPVAYFAIYR